MPSDPAWDFRTAAGKGTVLRVLQRETEEMFELAAEPSRWHRPTACTGWEIRDMIGHLLDASLGYLSAFDLARRGVRAPDAIGVAGFAEASDDAARAFRSVPRAELLARYRDASDRVLQEFGALSDAEWTGLMLPDPYLGPLPAMIVAAGLLGGLTVHGWDVRQGLGGPHAIAGDAADLLVPFVFLFWWATADTSAVDTPYAIGIRTTGCNGGDTRVDVTGSGLQFGPGALAECAAVLDFDPASLVLTAYNRINGGTVRGDRARAAEFRALFVAI
jgi:uncharacterized protein (TIGR03083 family)